MPLWSTRENRLGFASKLIKDFNVSGVVWYELLCCETYDSELYHFTKNMEKMNIPVLILESDYYCISTGYGRINVPIAQQAMSEIACITRGANFFYGPGASTIIDMGGQDCKVIRVDDKGRVVKLLTSAFAAV